MNRARTTYVLAALIGVLMFFYQYLTFRGFPNDHFLHVARAQQILLGDLPIRDFLDPGLPLMYGVSAAAYALFGQSLLTEAVVVFGLLAAAAALTCWIVIRTTGSFTLGVCLALLQVLIPPARPSYPKFLLYPLAVAAIWHYAAAPGAARTVVLAVVTVIAFLMRYDHGLFVGTGCLAAVAVAHLGDGHAAVLRSVSRYAFATAALLLPYFLYIHWAAGLVPYFRDAIEFSRAESGHYPVVFPAFAVEPRTALTFEQREATINVRWAEAINARERAALESRFGLSPDGSPEGRTHRYRIQDVSRIAIERLVHDPAVDDTAGIDRAAFRVDADRFDDSCRICIAAGPGLHLEQNAVAWLYYLTWATVAIGAVLVLARAPHAPVIAGITVMTAMAASTFLRSILAARISDIWGLLPLLLGPGVAAAFRSPRYRPALRTLAALALVATASAVFVVGDVREELDWAGLIGSKSPIARFSEVTNALARPQDALQRLDEGDPRRRSALAYVAMCTRAADRLLVLGFAPEFFWITHRGFAAGYATFVRGHHGSDEVQRLGLERWRRESVPFAIAFEGQYPEIAAAFPLIDRELHDRYSPVYREDAEGDRGALIVFAERDRPVEGTYQPLGTPCFNAPVAPAS